MAWVTLWHADFHPHLEWRVILKSQPELQDKNKIFTIWENTHIHSFYPNMTGMLLTLPRDHFRHPVKYWDPVICFNNQERGWDWTWWGFFQCMGKCGKQGGPTVLWGDQGIRNMKRRLFTNEDGAETWDTHGKRKGHGGKYFSKVLEKRQVCSEKKCFGRRVSKRVKSAMMCTRERSHHSCKSELW